jgi:ferredoxin-NADP reductase/ferredoxin
MFKDLKKFNAVRKLKSLREQVQQIPEYFDILENLHQNLHPGKIWVEVSDIINLSHDTKLFRLIPARATETLPPFRAGQFIGLSVDINGVNTVRPYSILSSPNQHAFYEIGVRRKEDGFVSPYLLDQLNIGDILEATEPSGNFYYNNAFHGNNLVFIAGGCGITPFISILRDISERVLPINVTLIYGCLTEKDILFREELEDLQKRRPNFNFNCILSEPEDNWKGECGFISNEVISNSIGSVEDKFFYIVGSREMYHYIKSELETLGVKQHKMIYESYGIPDDVTTIVGWPSEIDSSKNIKIKIDFFKNGVKNTEEIDGKCNDPILISIERAKNLDFLIDSGCRSGTCGLCRTKLLVGEVFMPPEVYMREMDHTFGFIHPCISYPISDIHIDLSQTKFL